MMDFTQLLIAYGPVWAAVVAAAVWAAKTYITTIRPERLAKEARLLEAFEKNTAAYLKLEAAIDHNTEMNRQRTEAQTAAMAEIRDQLRHLVEDVIEVRVKMGLPGTRRE